LELRVLGPVEVLVDGRPLALGARKQRAVLAMLVLEANRPVSTDRLIEGLWGESPPASAGKMVQHYVWQLRKALDGCEEKIVTTGRGYRLSCAPEDVDLVRAERLVASAAAGGSSNGDAREALALWRGAPLADLADEPFAAAEIRRCDELWLQAKQLAIDAELAAGRHEQALREVRPLAAEHPLSEHLQAQLMLALYRSGRQAEALEAFRTARSRLVEQIGAEPGPELRAVHDAVLQQDPALGAPDALPSAPRAARRRARPAVLLSAGAAVLAAALAAILVIDGSGHTTGGLAEVRGDSVVEIDPATNRVVGEYPVGGTPTVVSAAGGAVWTINADGQTLSRIDERRTVRTSAIDSVPLDLAGGPDALWVVTGVRTEEGKATVSDLVRLDPVSGEQLASTRLRPANGKEFRIPPQLVAVGGGAVWAIGRTGWLHRIDSRTGATAIRRTPAAEEVAAGAGQVWALTDGPRGPRLVELDPATGAVTRSVDVPATEPGSLAVGNGAVWLTDAAAGTLWRIDSGGRPVVRTIPLAEGVDGVAVGAGGVWASNGLAGTVTRIDPATNAPAKPIAVGNTPRSVGVSNGHVWVTVAGGGRPVAPAAGSLRADSPVRPLATSACRPVLTGPDGRADVLIGSELPLQAAARSTSQSMSAAVAFVVRQHRFRAGRFRVALQTCDDATAQSPLPFDEDKCRANAKAYAADRSVVGVIGPMLSGCTFQMLPILNGAPGGPLALVSPANTVKSLVRPDPSDPAGALARLYPAGQRGYARIMPAEDYEVAALALMARRLGHGSAFLLQDAYTAKGPYSDWFHQAARRSGLRIVGSATWNPKARSYRTLAERVRPSGTRAVVVLGNLTTNAGPVIRDLRAALGPDVPLVAYSGVTPISALFAQAGAAARGVYVSAGGPLLDRRRPAGRDFARAFGATRPDGRVTTFDAYAATATEVMLDAIARSDGTRASVSRALTATRLPDTPVGPIAFTHRGEPRRNEVAFARASRDLSGSIPFVYNDVTGGVVERVIAPSASLVATGR
jgi:DNA-binding SARP family transcriptional activator/ABC-type branched-subunit amino acid transport system substrate-binding protein